MKKIILSICLMAFAALTTQQVLAHGGATGIVKQRMDSMEEMKDSVKAAGAIFKGRSDYNADTIRKAAEAIKIHSGDAITALFPEGSLSRHSEAKPLIWDEWQRFKTLAERQTRMAEGLYLAADNQIGNNMASANLSEQGMEDPQILGQMSSHAVFKMLVDNCSSCHDRYREED